MLFLSLLGELKKENQKILTSMRSHMNDELPGLIETFLTIYALMRSLISRVGAYVSL